MSIPPQSDPNEETGQSSPDTNGQAALPSADPSPSASQSDPDVVRSTLDETEQGAPGQPAGSPAIVHSLSPSQANPDDEEAEAKEAGTAPGEALTAVQQSRRWSEMVADVGPVAANAAAKLWQEYQAQQDHSLRKQLQEAEVEIKKIQVEGIEAKWQAEIEANEAKWQAEIEANRTKWQAEMNAREAEWRADVQAETTSDKIRSLVLVLVILAVVAAPIFGMLKTIPPAEFIQYITPITGITGTVLGYWFGTQDSRPKRR